MPETTADAGLVRISKPCAAKETPIRWEGSHPKRKRGGGKREKATVSFNCGGDRARGRQNHPMSSLAADNEEETTRFLLCQHQEGEKGMKFLLRVAWKNRLVGLDDLGKKVFHSICGKKQENEKANTEMRKK